MAKTAYEQLLGLLDADTRSKVEAGIAGDKRLSAELQKADLFNIYSEADSGEPAATPTPTPTPAPAAAAVHVPALPSAAAAAAPTPTPTPSPASPAPSNDSAAILQALNGLKTTMETNFKNVVTKDQLPTLQSQMLESAIRNAHQTFKIEVLHKATFNEDLDLDKVGTFIDEQKKAGVTFPTVEKAYMAMVADKMNEKIIEQKVADGVKQKLSGATVPGQTTSTALSPAQQVMAKAKKDGAAEGGSRLQNLIDRASALERGREAAGTSVQ